MKIYLAGPDVFKKDAKKIYLLRKSEARRLGVEALSPSYNILKEAKEVQADYVCDMNIEMIKEADVVIANLTSFRGTEPDSGTCFEVGYAKALGKPIYAYSEDPHKEYKDHPLFLHFHLNSSIEDFGQPFNLMLARTVECVSESFEGALEIAVKEFGKFREE